MEVHHHSWVQRSTLAVEINMKYIGLWAIVCLQDAGGKTFLNSIRLMKEFLARTGGICRRGSGALLEKFVVNGLLKFGENMEDDRKAGAS